MLRRTDRPSHEEMSVKCKGWLSQGAVISLRKPKGGDGWHWRFGKNEICSRVPCLPMDLEPFRGWGCYCCAERTQYSWPLRCSHCGSGHLLQRGTFTARNLPGPCLGFLLGGSAKGVQQICSGSSTRLRTLVIFAAIALEHSSQIFSYARASFGHIFKFCVTFCNSSDKYFLILRHLEK